MGLRQKAGTGLRKASGVPGLAGRSAHATDVAQERIRATAASQLKTLYESDNWSPLRSRREAQPQPTLQRTRQIPRRQRVAQRQLLAGEFRVYRRPQRRSEGRHPPPRLQAAQVRGGTSAVATDSPGISGTSRSRLAYCSGSVPFTQSERLIRTAPRS